MGGFEQGRVLASLRVFLHLLQIKIQFNCFCRAVISLQLFDGAQASHAGCPAHRRLPKGVFSIWTDLTLGNTVLKCLLHTCSTFGRRWAINSTLRALLSVKVEFTNRRRSRYLWRAFLLAWGWVALLDFSNGWDWTGLSLNRALGFKHRFELLSLHFSNLCSELLKHLSLEIMHNDGWALPLLHWLNLLQNYLSLLVLFCKLSLFVVLHIYN